MNHNRYSPGGFRRSPRGGYRNDSGFQMGGRMPDLVPTDFRGERLYEDYRDNYGDRRDRYEDPRDSLVHRNVVPLLSADSGNRLNESDGLLLHNLQLLEMTKSVLHNLTSDRSNQRYLNQSSSFGFPHNLDGDKRVVTLGQNEGHGSFQRRGGPPSRRVRGGHMLKSRGLGPQLLKRLGSKTNESDDSLGDGSPPTKQMRTSDGLSKVVRGGFKTSKGISRGGLSLSSNTLKKANICTICNMAIESNFFEHKKTQVHKNRQNVIQRGCSECGVAKFYTYREMKMHMNTKHAAVSGKDSEDQVTSTGVTETSVDEAKSTNKTPLVKVVKKVNSAGPKFATTGAASATTPGATANKTLTGPGTGKVLTPTAGVKKPVVTTGKTTPLMSKSPSTSLTSPSSTIKPLMKKVVTPSNQTNSISKPAAGSVVKTVSPSTSQTSTIAGKRLPVKRKSETGVQGSEPSKVTPSGASSVLNKSCGELSGEMEQISVADEPDPLSSDLVYDPETVQGGRYVIKVTGYFCKLCNKFYNSENYAKTIHCKSEPHFQKYKAALKVKEQQQSQTSQAENGGAGD